jgi:hypothetical protein
MSYCLNFCCYGTQSSQPQACPRRPILPIEGVYTLSMANIGHQERSRWPILAIKRYLNGQYWGCHTLLMAVTGHREGWHSLNGRYWPLREYTLFWWSMTTIKRARTVSMADIGHQGSAHSLDGRYRPQGSTHSLDGQYRPSRDECVPLDGWYRPSREYTLSWWPISAIQESVCSLDGRYSIDPLWWQLPAIETQFADFMGYIRAIINP